MALSTRPLLGHLLGPPTRRRPTRGLLGLVLGLNLLVLVHLRGLVLVHLRGRS